MRISLIFPSWFGEFGDFRDSARRVSTFPPLNLCIIASLAKKAGWETQLIDAHIEGLDDRALTERVGKFNPDLIGLTATTPFYHNAARIARMLKKEFNKPVIIGGPHVSYHREKVFDDGLDYAVIGECETTFASFLGQVGNGNRNPEVPGVMMTDRGRILYKGAAPILTDLDAAPLPDRELLKNDLYLLGTPHGTRRYTSVQMSRGCPFSCVFCASDLYGKVVRRRSIGNVIAELDSIVNRYGAEHIYFIDDILTLDRGYIMRLCDAIQEHGLKFTFEGSSRADLWDEEMAIRLKECGLIRMSFGLESVDEKIRKIIKKDIPMGSYIDANRINNRLGIETTNSVIIGLPGDTRESIRGTVRYLCAHREIQHVTLNVAVPYPGTEMLKMAERGEYGLKLIERSFRKFQRYGSAVMEVNGMRAQELVDIQRKALLRIYSCWWRWMPALRRFGMITIMRTAFNVMLSLVKPRSGGAESRIVNGAG
ncbi:MAG: radical SAM protein [Candidatus Omnitrophota bacterium]